MMRVTRMRRMIARGTGPVHELPRPYRPVANVGSSAHTSTTTGPAAGLPPSGKRTDAVGAVPGARGLPGRDAHLLHHPGAAGDPRPRRGPPARVQGAVRRDPAGAQRCRTGRAALAG